jgi:hypothetical protein
MDLALQVPHHEHTCVADDPGSRVARHNVHERQLQRTGPATIEGKPRLAMSFEFHIIGGQTFCGAKATSSARFHLPQPKSSHRALVRR